MVHRETDMSIPVAEEVFRNTFLKVFETLVTFIAKGQEKGILRKDLEPEIMSVNFFGGIVHMLRSDRIGEKFFGRTLKDPAYRERALHHVIEMGLHGLIGERSQQK
jgi:hypothetical protein